MSHAAAPALPLTVHVGFAGPRRFAGAWAASPEGLAVLRSRLQAKLARLPDDLGLGPSHFITAVSQLAVGADTLFTEAAAALDWLQRIVLPQPAQDYLAAQGSTGPDFTADERRRAAQLLASPHIVEVSVASTADTRAQRFEQTNLRILAESDVLVILRVAGAPERPGGTAELLRRARQRGMHRLVLTLVEDAAGQPDVVAEWEASQDHPFAPPQPPTCVRDATPPPPWRAGAAPALQAYAQHVKQAASARARKRQRFFRYAAAVVVGSHGAATALALLALKAPLDTTALLAVLAIELAMLAWGFATHRKLHHERATYDWAMARLCAELARSAQAVQGLALSLSAMQVQVFPAELQPMLRTMLVLHLRDGRQAPQDWSQVRDRYLRERMDAASGQIPYYEREAGHAHRLADRAAWFFTVCSGAAFAATLVKALIVGSPAASAWQGVASFAGPLAILLPVMAVGAMSVAAALDAEGRAHTFKDTLRFVRAQADRIRAATSGHELAAHVLATESRLLGETLGWVGRRAYLGVS